MEVDKMDTRADVSTTGQVIVLNVGGTEYATTADTLCKHEGSMLAAMFSGRFRLSLDKQGRAFIDRNGKRFEAVLDYLRDGTEPNTELELKELVYFGLKSPDTKVHCHASERYLVFWGFAVWKQKKTDTVQQQEALMEAAAKAVHPNCRPASIADYKSKSIRSLPESNTSGSYVTFVGPGNVAPLSHKDWAISGADPNERSLLAIDKDGSLDGSVEAAKFRVAISWESRAILCVMKVAPCPADDGKHGDVIDRGESQR